MTTIVRQFGYAPYVQELTWTQGQNIAVTAHLWGGGGGGGGNDSHVGGYGSGGSYTSSTFTLSQGDVLGIAVGGAGRAGVSGRGGAAGGAAGASLVSGDPFNSRTATPVSGSVYPVTNGAYCAFLNTYGVWGDPAGAAGSFDKTYNVNFPTTGSYTFTSSCDNYGSILLDGTNILDVPDFHYSVSTTITVSAGYHTVRVIGVNTGGPGSIGLTISGNSQSFSGGNGGYAGYSGSSGGGGGGGGATVLVLNDSVIAVAGGGGGGGGGGNAGAATGQSAPGTRGLAPAGLNAGQNGENKGGDGGGGGGAGGGYGGGQGGAVPGGDQGGYAGYYGGSTGTPSVATGVAPGGSSAPYYTTARAYGGAPASAGNSGWAVLEFAIGGTFVNIDGVYTTTKQTWVKDGVMWKPVKATYIKKDGVWTPVLGSFAPVFGTDVDSFGIASRPFS